MAAFLLLLLVILAAANLAFTVRMYRLVKDEGKKALLRKVEIPKRKAVRMEPEKNNEIDYQSIVNQAMQAVKDNAEESGEEVPELSPDDIQRATSAVLAAMQK